MELSLVSLAELVKAHREEQGTTQEALAKGLGAPHNRSEIAHLEQATKLPPPKSIEAICSSLKIPPKLWQPYTNAQTHQRLKFEQIFSELIGRPLSLYGHTRISIHSAERQISLLFDGSLTSETHYYDGLNSVLTFYSARHLGRDFFLHYIGPRSFASLDALQKSVTVFHVDALRMFPTFEAAFEELNGAPNLKEILAPLAPRSDSTYRERSRWAGIVEIPEGELRDLGYVSASTAEKQDEDRQFLVNALLDLAKNKERGGAPLTGITEKRQSRIVALLTKFHTTLKPDQISPMFLPSAEELRRQADAVAPPKDAARIARRKATQETAETNLASYLSADHLDVYIATSMRTPADFVSVSRFSRSLFSHELIAPLSLRYFNPTQSWILDRIAKGLVEALMLKRAAVTIYMAQKTDSFGKDSEASVALGHGKAVVVFVPRLFLPEQEFDSGELGRAGDDELLSRGAKTIPDFDGSEYRTQDGGLDRTAIIARVIQVAVDAIQPDGLAVVARDHWADFDLAGEALRASDDKALQAEYAEWATTCAAASDWTPPSATVALCVRRVIAIVAADFERRATMFREIHPLALQVILSTGVLNGILVVRSVADCAATLAELLRNELKLSVHSDDNNYKLIEERTSSTIRVISRHRLIRNAFTKYYRRD